MASDEIIIASAVALYLKKGLKYDQAVDKKQVKKDQANSYVNLLRELRLEPHN